MSTQWFLKVDGIPGESQADRHRGEIDVRSWEWGVSHQAAVSASTGSVAGRPSFEGLRVTTSVSMASPLLLRAAATGTRIREVTLTGRRAGGSAGGVVFLVNRLRNVAVTSVQHAGAEGDAPHEELTLQATSVEVTYTPVTSAGGAGTPVRFGYDLAASKVT